MGLVTALFPGLGGFTRYNLYAVGLSLLFDLPDLYATLFCTLWYVTRHAQKNAPPLIRAARACFPGVFFSPSTLPA